MLSNNKVRNDGQSCSGTITIFVIWPTLSLSNEKLPIISTTNMQIASFRGVVFIDRRN